MNRTSNHFIHLRSISWNVVSAQFAEKYLISKKSGCGSDTWRISRRERPWCNVATCQKIFQDATASTASDKPHKKTWEKCERVWPSETTNFIKLNRLSPFSFPLQLFDQISIVSNLWLQAFLHRIRKSRYICFRFSLFLKFPFFF